jgi:uncharacterized protein YcfJ
MIRSTRSLGPLVVCTLLCSSLAGCQNMNKTTAGAGLGAGAGALAGAIIGHQTGNAEKGALIGAALGGVGGGLTGHAMDKTDERDAAMAHASHTEAARRADQRAMTNSDVIYMTKSGTSDQIIIGTIQNRGGRFQMDPQSVVSLQQNGVSDGVIQVMQRHGS